MMIAIEVSTVKIFGWPMLITRMIAAMMPIDDRGDDRRLGLRVDRASFSPNGSALSRAIAKVSRIAAVCTASVHTVTATTMQIRKILPSGPHITCSTMYCRPPLLSPICGSSRFGRRHHREHQDAPPITNEARIARKIAFGAVRRGSTVSSPSELAVSKPYIT